MEGSRLGREFNVAPMGASLSFRHPTSLAASEEGTVSRILVKGGGKAAVRGSQVPPVHSPALV